MDVETQIAKLIRRYFGKDDPYGSLLAVRQHFHIVELSTEGEVLGFLLYDEKKTHYEGLRSAVLTKARRQGIGMKLFKRLIRKSCRTGKPYRTYTSIDNIASLNSHIKAGMLVESIDNEWVWIRTS